MPSRRERAQFELDPGVPVLEIRRTDGTSKLFAANQVTVVSAAR
jgi:hypothetical protein